MRVNRLWLKQTEPVNRLKDKWQARCFDNIRYAIQEGPCVFRVDAPRRSGKTLLSHRLGVRQWETYNPNTEAKMIVLDEWQDMNF